MASGFFALFDDIATLMEDVATMGKIATKKTAGILGDDLAVNAEKASGFISSREIPVLIAITKGSFINKLIILPGAFLLSAFLPWLIVPILLLGGIYLAYEGAEKIYEFIFPHEPKAHIRKDLPSEEDILKFEKKKIKSAIFVDFILSIEIIIIALSTVVNEDLPVQIIVVSIVAFLATIGVYGIVALIVRMDDMGYSMIASGKNKFTKSTGKLLVKALPVVIKALSVIGTIAMILVAGGIYMHNIHYVHDLFHAIPSLIADFIVGIIIGFIAFSIVKLALFFYDKIISVIHNK